MNDSINKYRVKFRKRGKSEKYNDGTTKSFCRVKLSFEAAVSMKNYDKNK